MPGFSEILTVMAGVASLGCLAWSLWDLFRTPDTLLVTYLPTGRSVIINMKAGPAEGRKLVELCQPLPSSVDEANPD